jgi:hypothetical protein
MCRCLGKIFPKLYRRTEQQASVISTHTIAEKEINESASLDQMDDEIPSPTADYVFRIVFLNDR